ncbi:nicotinamide riboside kinase 1 isoform X1 [Mustela putorius furo]|uniref:Nicotinamide riboside kinase 1 isoform X1 n=1 Tax=Mustela putorius furo TaxID=9669 RepID=A0A8U0N7Z2_MUSPF|nr:nicotinamide riboside kinase 1 isoform X1 [Mustela putorius furo]
MSQGYCRGWRVRIPESSGREQATGYQTGGHRLQKWQQEMRESPLNRDTGVTNGGKTTLAKKLQKHLPNCSVISQDDFFKPQSEIETDTNGFLQYDVLEALNMEKMMSAISRWMESPRHSPVSTDSGSTEEIPILIIEGFLLFNYKPLDALWNRSYFLTIPYEECKRRRSTRVYEPPDVPGYFDGHVWPMYLKHRQEIENITWEIIYLDGTKSEEDLFSQVYEELKQELAKHKCLQVTT